MGGNGTTLRVHYSRFGTTALATLNTASRYERWSVFAPEVVAIGDGGGYRMFYAGVRTPEDAFILSAWSADGLEVIFQWKNPAFLLENPDFLSKNVDYIIYQWVKDLSPVISPGGRWDRVKSSEMCVMQLQTGAFRLLYEGCDGTAAGLRGVWRINSATSAPARL